MENAPFLLSRQEVESCLTLPHDRRIWVDSPDTSLSLLPRPHRKGLGTKLAIDTKSVAIKPLQINL